MENNRSILSNILNPNDLDLELLRIYKKNYPNIKFLKIVEYKDGITEITIKSNDGDSIITIGHGKLSCNSETAIFTSDSFTNVNIELQGLALNFNIGECITVSCEGKKTIIPNSSNSFNISTHFTDANLYFTLAVINYGTKAFLEKVNELITKTNIETSNGLNIDGLVEDLPPELPEELQSFKKSSPIEYKAGDVVWADTLPGGTLQEIVKDKQQRPYVIVSKGENGYVAFACTSKIERPRNKLVIKNPDREGNSAVMMSQLFTLPENSITNLMGHLSEQDAIRLAKKLGRRGDKNFDLVDEYKEKLKLEVGDFMSIDDKTYYLYAFERGIYHLFAVSNIFDNEDACIIINGLIVNVSNSILIKASDVESFRIVDTTTPSESIEIDAKRKKYNKQEVKPLDPKNIQPNEDLTDFSRNIELHLGDVVKYADEKELVYLGTNESVKKHYFVDQEELNIRPLRFCAEKPINAQYYVAGHLSNEELKLILGSITKIIGLLTNQCIVNIVRDAERNLANMSSEEEMRLRRIPSNNSKKDYK